MKQVIEVKRLSSEIITLELVVNEDIISVISVHGPQCCRREEENSAFHDELNTVVWVQDEKYIMGDL